MLLVANYIFYGAWDWRFLSLILASTVIDFFCGLKIHGSNDARRRRRFLFVSISCNLCLLGFFKYFNFFTDNLELLLGQFGVSTDWRFLTIILPVGISFYTFQTMSYTIDIYRRELAPTRSFLDFALFVSFFPQLVAGPIERARDLLPQILHERQLSWAKFTEGCHLILWGLFQKVFVADNLARIVDPVFDSETTANGAAVLLATYAFAFQIFCDFAGYSNIARGLGKCMGMELTVNFNLPYFATNPRQFWQRWHISLSTWLRDYLYIPLGGNRKGSARTCRNLLITMLLGGLWHGAAWTFVLWGLYHGLLMMIHRIVSPFLGRIGFSRGSLAEKVWFAVRVVFFFHLICLGWLIFRAQSPDRFVSMLSAIAMNFDVGAVPGLAKLCRQLVFFLSVLVMIQCFQYRSGNLLAVYKTSTIPSAVIHAVMLYLMVINAEPNHAFIYFQF